MSENVITEPRIVVKQETGKQISAEIEAQKLNVGRDERSKSCENTEAPAKAEVSQKVEQQQAIEKTKDIGVPKFLVNKWLGIKNNKSAFVEKQNQVDNEADISVYSETSRGSSIALNFGRNSMAISKLMKKSTLHVNAENLCDQANMPRFSNFRRHSPNLSQGNSNKIIPASMDENKASMSELSVKLTHKESVDTVSEVESPPGVKGKSFNAQKQVIFEEHGSSSEDEDYTSVAKSLSNSFSHSTPANNQKHEYKPSKFKAEPEQRLPKFSDKVVVKSQLKDKLEKYQKLKSKNIWFKKINSKSVDRSGNNSQNKLAETLHATQRAFNVKGKFRSLFQSSNIFKGKKVFAFDNSKHLNALKNRLPRGHTIKNENKAFSQSRSKPKASSLSRKRNVLNNTFSMFSQTFNTKKIATIPTSVDLKETFDSHGKSFAKFRMQFKSPEVCFRNQNLSSGHLAMFECSNTQFRSVRSPKVKLIASGVNPLGQTTLPQVKSPVPTQAGAVRRKLQIELDNPRHGEAVNLKRIWSPVGITTCTLSRDIL